MSAADYHHAALVFQHGNKSEHYKLAHKFAEKAVELGDTSAKWLYAATLDRWLLSIGQPQKFGTQFRKNNKGNWELAPTDKTVSDGERAEYNVPPLSRALQRFKKKYGL